MRLIATWAVLLPGILLSACGGDSGPSGDGDPPSGIDHIEVSQIPLLEVSDTFRLVATPVDSVFQPVPNITVTFKSLDATVATVTTSGLVTGVDEGTSVIRVTAKDKSVDVPVVVPRPANTILFTDLIDSVIVRQGAQLVWFVTDAGGLEITRDPRFTSSDTLRARVNFFSGAVTGVGPGPVTITAKLGPATATKVIDVLPAVASVTITPADTSIVLGDSVQMTATLKDSTGAVLTGRPYTWGANDSGIITAGGVATGALTGPAYLFASSEGALDSTSFHITTGSPFTQFGLGTNHSCALTADGRAWCWGNNFTGAVGVDINIPIVKYPMPVSGSYNFTSLTAGGGHNCALTSLGQAYCWGLTNLGESGVDPNNAQFCSANTRCIDAPFLVPGGLAFQSLTAGATHTCGLVSGHAYCWGDNTTGALGIGSADNQVHTTPTAVAGGLTFTALAAGYWHTCGLTGAGAVYCWGRNNQGQLGIGTADTNLHTSPEAVTGGHVFMALSTGSYTGQTCGIRQDGAVYCWGWVYPGDQPAPVQVFAGPALTVATGSDHLCLVTSAGAPLCQGGNIVGQIGDGTQLERLTPSPVSGGLTLTGVWAGQYHNCGIGGGIAYCWGEGANYQLGNGFGTRLVPTRVEGQ